MWDGAGLATLLTIDCGRQHTGLECERAVCVALREPGGHGGAPRRRWAERRRATSRRRRCSVLSVGACQATVFGFPSRRQLLSFWAAAARTGTPAAAGSGLATRRRLVQLAATEASSGRAVLWRRCHGLAPGAGGPRRQPGHTHLARDDRSHRPRRPARSHVSSSRGRVRSRFLSPEVEHQFREQRKKTCSDANRPRHAMCQAGGACKEWRTQCNRS